MDKIYYYNIMKKEEKNAGIKAVNDCNNILASMGYSSIDLIVPESSESIFIKVKKYIAMFCKFFLKYDAKIVVQHPIVWKFYIDILGIAKEIRKLEYIFLIHDLNSLRYKSKEYYTDKKMLQIADYIISHNQKMTDYLVQKGVSEDKIINLEIFDYLGDIKQKSIRFSPVLNIAGNLSVNKCEYLKQLKDIQNGTFFNLYGINFDASILSSEVISYKGAFEPEEVPNQLIEGFGLVWDGTSINGCKGHTGEYLKYNNPHKLSLYLASGLPVVISEEAAEADYVRENNVGIVVKRIEDFKEYYDEMTLEDYTKMLKCVNECAEKINKGYYLKRAMQEVEKRQRNESTKY